MSTACHIDEVMEAVEAGLDQSGFTWKRRETGWVVPAGRGQPREIQITVADAVVLVQAVLVQWDEIGADESAALAACFARAGVNLSGTECELEANQVSVVARVDAASAETALPDAVGAVAAGVSTLAREVGALLVPEVARAYLRFQGGNASTGPIPS